MFVPITERERYAFLRQNERCFVPGYTGHCPSLKFKYGKCYSTTTREILQEFKDKMALLDVRNFRYRPEDYIVNEPVKYHSDHRRDYADEINRRAGKYVMGYTGYIPGLNFAYGKSYGRTATECMQHFDEYQTDKWRKIDSERVQYRTPVMTSIRGKDEVDRELRKYEDNTKYKDHGLSPESPPISGYTGHIPKVRIADDILAQRYSSAASKGLQVVQEDRKNRDKFSDVGNRIRQVLNSRENRYDLKYD